MLTVKSGLVALALGLAVTAFASPSFAQGSGGFTSAPHAPRPFMSAASGPVDIRSIPGVTPRPMCMTPVWLNMAKSDNARAGQDPVAVDKSANDISRVRR